MRIQLALTRRRDGSALFSYGFRPFFLLASMFAILSAVVWLPAYYGDISISTVFSPVVWHAHEMLYGYFPAVATGFLLTAIPNWTGRLPLKGPPLAALAALWFSGRVAVSFGAQIGWLGATIIDCSFLLAVCTVMTREVAAGKNLKNLKVVALIFILLVGNMTFHIEARWNGLADYGIRIGLSGMIMLVAVIGGRIIPSFTRNWLGRQAQGRMPVAFNRFDVTVIGFSALTLITWVVFPEAAVTDGLLAIAACLHLMRLARWAGERTFNDRLVLILHVAYLFVPAGFLLLAAAGILDIPTSAGIHAWTIGAMTTLTFAVMTRATLGHTGRSLRANAATQIIYGSVIGAVMLRIGAALAHSDILLQLSALAWCVAFLLFAATYGPMLLRPKLGAIEGR